MNRQFLPRSLLGATLIAAMAAVVTAQGPGGGSDDTFRQLDRNGNDAIDPEEWEALPATFRKAFEDRGVDLSVSMEYDDFVETSRAIREEMMARFTQGGGGGGRRGPPGPPPPAAPAADAMRSEEKKTEKVVIRASKPKNSMNVKLPEAYRAKDTNRDGQIGLYEWSLSDYKTFRKLDLNGDGFLTPQELIKGPRAVVEVSRTSTSSSTTGPASATTSSDSGTASSTTGKSESPSSGPSGPKNPADTAFKLLDKDNDGMISEKEWGKSMSTGPKFKTAGVQVTFPLRKEVFLQLYPQAYPSAAK
ncbi:MAG: hypothetical protein EXS05_20865 [Planctomycetaceae bacterium]|nr:hypothetical protein [Planctomycetaceae bacterium]